MGRGHFFPSSTPPCEQGCRSNVCKTDKFVGRDSSPCPSFEPLTIHAHGRVGYFSDTKRRASLSNTYVIHACAFIYIYSSITSFVLCSPMSSRPCSIACPMSSQASSIASPPPCPLSSMSACQSKDWPTSIKVDMKHASFSRHSSYLWPPAPHHQCAASSA